jgi:hypothetical protein
MTAISTQSSFRVTVNAEHRTGLCEKCNTLTVKQLYMDGNRQRVRMICPSCGGQGKLIARVYSITAPPPPKCLSVRCLAKFIYDCLYSAFLASYHRRRVYFAESHRHDTILERYRTGSPSPANLWQSIHANIKLTCPICRKYNVDPLLFKEK